MSSMQRGLLVTLAAETLQAKGLRHLLKQQKTWWLWLHEFRVWVLMDISWIGAGMLRVVQRNEINRCR